MSHLVDEEHPEREIDYLPLSGLQHLAYCPRQFALIHIEQAWLENRFTAEGQILHERVDSGESETRNDLHIARSLRLASQQLGLTGVADVVEFKRVSGGDAVQLEGRRGRWQPFPVEYKRGRSKADNWDRIQLCAQAMCLEEMFEVPIPQGALFYGKPRRREWVDLDTDLRDETRTLAKRMHQLWDSRRTPPPEPGPKCDRCSLRPVCMPEQGSASAYLKRMLAE